MKDSDARRMRVDVENRDVYTSHSRRQEMWCISGRLREMLAMERKTVFGPQTERVSVWRDEIGCGV